MRESLVPMAMEGPKEKDDTATSITLARMIVRNEVIVDRVCSQCELKLCSSSNIAKYIYMVCIIV